MAQIFLGGLFGNINDPAYHLTTEKAEHLKAPLRTKVIAAEVVLEGNVDWDGATLPTGRDVIIEVGDADLDRAKAIVDTAG